MIDALGAISVPIAASAVTDSLAVLDPARSELTGLLKAAINGDCGAAWRKVTALLPTGHQLRDTLPVQTVLELEPDAATLGEIKVKFPLLAVYRQGEPTFQWKEARRRYQIQKWNADLVIGPMGTDVARKLGDICRAAAVSATNAILHGFYAGHPSASPPIPGYKAGNALVVPVASMEVVGILGPGYSKVSDTAAPYYGTTFVIETWELTQPITDPVDDQQMDTATPDVGIMDVDLSLQVPAVDGVTWPHFIKSGPPTP